MTAPFLRRAVAIVLAAGLTITGSSAAAQELATPVAPTIFRLPDAAPAVSSAASLDPGDARNPDVEPSRSLWRDLFLDTAGDLRRLPSRRTFGWLALGAIAAVSTKPADSHVGRTLSGVRMLEEPLEPGAVIGSTPLQLGLSAATYGIGHAFRSPRMMTVGADLFRAELVAQALTMGMKESFRRHRPEGSGFAFPSGHTTVSFASATVLQEHFGWKVGFPAYALASYVAVSRVHMKRHYLSDVAFGAALGIAAGRTIVVGHGQKWRVEPMASLAGGGVQVRWLGKETRN